MEDDFRPIAAARIDHLDALAKGTTRMHNQRTTQPPRDLQLRHERRALPAEDLGRLSLVLRQMEPVEPRLAERDRPGGTGVPPVIRRTHGRDARAIFPKRLDLRHRSGPIRLDRTRMQPHRVMDKSGIFPAISRYKDQSSGAVPMAIIASRPASRARCNTAGNSPRRAKESRCVWESISGMLKIVLVLRSLSRSQKPRTSTRNDDENAQDYFKYNAPYRSFR